MPSLTTCQRPTNKIFKRVSQTVCVSAWVWCFAMIPIPFFLHFLSSSCFNGALRHWHSGTLCWEGHRKHHGQVTHGWKGHSPRGVIHDGTMAGIIHLEHDGINGKGCNWLVGSDPQESLKYWPFNSQRNTTVRSVILPMLSSRCCLFYCVTVWALTLRVFFFRYWGVTLTDSWCFLNNLEIWLSHQMLISLPVHKRWL